MSKLKEILKDKDRRRGIIGTTIVHLLLIVALLFLALRTPLPLPGEEGVEVNLGYDDQGYGDIQSDEPAPISEPTPPPPQEQQPVYEEPEPEIVEEEIITQDIEEAPVIEEEVIEEKPEEIKEPEEILEEKPEPEPEKEIIEKEPEEQPIDSTFTTESEEIVDEPVEEPKPVVNKRALYPGSSKTSTDGTNQGIEPGTGDMGKPEGYKESEKYDGKGGEGNGISYSLGGRGSKYLDKPKPRFKEPGRVVIKIEVDKQGNVLKASFQQLGSNVGILDEKVQLAIDAAKNSVFTESNSAPDKQVGTITYNFIK